MAGLRKNILYSGFLTTSLYIFQFITYPYVARVLGVTNIGICNFVQSIVQYFMLFSMLGVSTLGIREIASCGIDESKRNLVFSKLIQLTCIITSIVIVFYLVCIELVPTLSQYRKLLYIGALQIVFNTLTIEWFYRGIENFKFITVRTFIVRTIYVVLTFLLIQSSKDYYIYFILTSLTYIINGIINLLHSKRFIHFHWQKTNELRCYIKPILYLGLLSILGAMYTSFNTIYLGFVTNDTEVGYYTTATKIQNIILGIYTAFTLAMIPRMSNCKSVLESKRLLDISMEFLINFSIPIVIIFEFFADTIILIISGSQYIPATPMLMITTPLIFIIGIRQIFVAQILIPNKADKATFFNSLIGGVIGVVLNFLFVGTLKGIGASIVIIISECAVTGSAYYFVQKLSLYSIDKRKLTSNIVYWLPLVLICWGANQLENSFNGLLVSAILALILFHINMQYIVKNTQYRHIINHLIRKRNKL